MLKCHIEIVLNQGGLIHRRTFMGGDQFKFKTHFGFIDVISGEGSDEASDDGIYTSAHLTKPGYDKDFYRLWWSLWQVTNDLHLLLTTGKTRGTLIQEVKAKDN